MTMATSFGTSKALDHGKDHNSIYASVQDHYGSAAKGRDDKYGHEVASAFGYSKEELTDVPTGSNLGLSCGNPFAVAKLREGETVIDLGSGAGFDVFQAAKKVGTSGKVIGVDMNEVDELLQARSIFASQTLMAYLGDALAGQRHQRKVQG